MGCYVSCKVRLWKDSNVWCCVGFCVDYDLLFEGIGFSVDYFSVGGFGEIGKYVVEIVVFWLQLWIGYCYGLIV